MGTAPSGDDARPLRAAVRRDLRRIGLAAALFLGVALFEPYDNRRSFGDADPAAAARDNVSLGDRLGYAVLLRAGYVEILEPPPDSDPEAALVGMEAEPNQPPTLQLREFHPDFSCASRGTGRALVDAQLLTVALAAVEAYNRRPARQRLEGAWAEAILRAGGRLPDLSLGAMQIRPSTARAVLHEELGGTELPDEEVVALLGHRCHSFRIAARLIRGYLAEAADLPADSAIGHAARRYSGAHSIDGRHHWYLEAVHGAYRLLYAARHPYGAEFWYGNESDEEPEPPAILSTCVYFRIGSVQPDEWPYVPEDPAGRARVTLFPVGQEPGPPFYAARMAERRFAALTERLRQDGVDDERITIDPVAPPSALTECGAPANQFSALLHVTGLTPPAPPAAGAEPLP